MSQIIKPFFFIQIFPKPDEDHISGGAVSIVLPPNFISMSVIYVLLTISIIVALVFFVAFIVAVKNGQFDDDYTPSVRMLFEDELVKEKQSEKESVITTNKTN